jgi:hypothetical protein
MTSRSRKGPTKARRGRQLPRVFLGYCFPRSPGLVHEEWARSLLYLFAGAQGKCLIQPVGCGSGPLLSRARNRLVQQFLEGDFDYFLWTDTDISFTYDDLSLLLLADKDIAGSVYFALDGNNEPCIAHLEEEPGAPEGEEGKKRYRDVPISKCYDDDSSPKEPFSVAGLGCGFTLIKMRVLVDLADSRGGTARLWPYAESGEEEGFGEDLTFALRAADLGFQSWLVPESKVGHIKEIVL